MENKDLTVRNYFDEILDIINSNKSNSMKKQLLSQYHESDIADVLDLLDDDKRKELYKILDTEALGEVILHSDDLEEIVEDIEPEVLADIIETMDADDALDVLEELDEEVRLEVVELIEDSEIKEDIETLSNYSNEVVGSEMSTNYICISTIDSVKSAMKKVIKEASDNDNVSTIFVLDENNLFYGVLDLRDLIISRENDDLKKVIKTNYPFFLDTDLIDEIIPQIRDYGLDSYPVLNASKELVGVLTHDDALDVTLEEFEDDYAKLAGISEENNLNEGIFKSIKKRIPWLIILLVLGLVQSFLMTGFEVVVAGLPIIVFFQTLVLGMSGNSGTQSLAVTIRSLSSQDMKKHVLKTLFKELRIGFFNGFLLALLAFSFVFSFLFIKKQGVTSEVFTINEAIKASSIVGLALLISMTISSFVGAIVPIFFKKIKIDPAVASGPFITTINDLTALLIYYGLAAILFNIIL
ncbi:MAG: magnesium transporter [Bacilli bacterium]|nr:magnesium transporter [Bacilli bacterium]